MKRKRTQSYDSPCAPSWTDDWIDRVDDAERGLGRQICGARTHAGTPCTLKPNHPNGRCKFHGGFDCTGAQPGNRNAVIHGLYARGIQRCGQHCSLWDHCPLVDDDLKAIPKNNRPQCPYETTQFQIALTDAEQRLHRFRAPDGLEHHIAHQVALLQVMVTRAAAALSVAPLIQHTHVKSGDYTLDTAKPAAALTAFSRLSSEYRRYLALLVPKNEYGTTQNEYNETQRRRAFDTAITPEATDALIQDPGNAEARAHLDDAAHSLAKLHKCNTHKQLDPKTQRENVIALRNEVSAAYQKAFDLMPILRDYAAADPSHDPSLFPGAQPPPHERQLAGPP